MEEKGKEEGIWVGASLPRGRCGTWVGVGEVEVVGVGGDTAAHFCIIALIRPNRIPARCQYHTHASATHMIVTHTCQYHTHVSTTYIQYHIHASTTQMPVPLNKKLRDP